MRRDQSPTRAGMLLGAAMVLLAAIPWILQQRVRSARSVPAPAARHPTAPTLPESTAEVTLPEYKGLCSADDVASCQRACDRGDAASCRSLGWHYEHGTGVL